MAGVVVFPASARQFQPYMSDRFPGGQDVARIARMVGSDLSSSMGCGVVTYKKLTVDWDLPFDEAIVVLEGKMRVYSDGKSYDCAPGDVAWFPARASLRHDVPDRVVVFYVTYPVASTLRQRS